MARLTGSKLISTYLMYHDNSRRQATQGAFDRLADAASHPFRPQALTFGFGDIARAGHAARTGGGVNTRGMARIAARLAFVEPAASLWLKTAVEAPQRTPGTRGTR